MAQCLDIYFHKVPTHKDVGHYGKRRDMIESS